MTPGFLVLTWNQVRYLRRCVQSLRRSTPASASRLVVIDNGSTDPDTLKYLDFLRAAGIEVLRLEENKGFAAGFNHGIRWMLENTDCDPIVLANNDIVFSEGWFDRIREFMVKHPGDAVSPDQAPNSPEMDAATQDLSGGDWFRYAAALSTKHAGESEEGLWFCCPVIPRALLEEVGPLDEGFGMATHEDCDYLLRIEMAGHKGWVCKDSLIYHYRGISTAVMNETQGEGYWHHARSYFEKKYHVVLGDAPCYRSIFYKPNGERLL